MYGRLDNAVIDYGTGDAVVQLRVPNGRTVMDKLRSLTGKGLEIGLKIARKKRSLSANAYAWVLIGKIAEATRQTVTNVYRHAIREIGGNTTVVTVFPEAVEAFRRSWEAHGSGWMTEIFGESDDGVDVILWYGSSTYDSEQMGRLIDGLIEDCRLLGIETMTPDQLAELEGLTPP